MLPLRAYLHACFVWYGLAKFWRAAEKSNEFSEAVVREHRARALTGFAAKDPASDLVSYAPALTTDVIAVISALYKELADSGDLEWLRNGEIH